MKNKFITTVVATALALTMTFSLANGMDVKAAEITEDSLVAAEDTNVGNESVDIQQQEPVEISELETTENNDLSKSSESITVDESIAEDIQKQVPQHPILENDLLGFADAVQELRSLQPFMGQPGLCAKDFGNVLPGALQYEAACTGDRQVNDLSFLENAAARFERSATRFQLTQVQSTYLVAV